MSQDGQTIVAKYFDKYTHKPLYVVFPSFSYDCELPSVEKLRCHPFTTLAQANVLLKKGSIISKPPFLFENLTDAARFAINIHLIDHYHIINPARREYEQFEYKTIVEKDKSEIDLCDIVLVNHTKCSDGTAMEILYAWERKKEIYTIVHGEVSPWILYHSNEIFMDMTKAVEFLMLTK